MVLDIRSSGDSRMIKMKIFVYGASGTGKSTLCGTGYGKVLYLYTEPQGVISFSRQNKNADMVEIKTIRDLQAVWLELKGGKLEYDTICLDSLTESQRLIIDTYVPRASFESKSKLISLPQWGDIINRTAALCDSFRKLPYHVIITALANEEILTKEDQTNEQIIRPTLNGKSLPNTIAQYFSIVGLTIKHRRKDDTIYRVILDSSKDVLTKNVPELNAHEIPDIADWHKRIFGEKNE